MLDEELFESEAFGCQKVKLYKIKHFIFDFSGVMLERTFVLDNLVEIIETDFNISIPKDEDPYFRKVKRRLSSGRIEAREFLELIFDQYHGKQPDKKQPNMSYYLELWFQLYTEVTKLSERMAEIVKRLQISGYTVSLMSNVYDIYAKSNELRGFYDVFNHTFLSNEIGLLKPDVEKYLYVLEKLEAKPKECVFIDDKLRNLIPAKELGIIIIQFKNFEQFQEHLKDIGIGELREDLRSKIVLEFKQYKRSKKEHKRLKIDYKRAKQNFFSNRGWTAKREEYFKKKRAEYLERRKEYKRMKKIKKEELETKSCLFEEKDP